MTLLFITPPLDFAAAPVLLVGLAVGLLMVVYGLNKRRRGE